MSSGLSSRESRIGIEAKQAGSHRCFYLRPKPRGLPLLSYKVLPVQLPFQGVCVCGVCPSPIPKAYPGACSGPITVTLTHDLVFSDSRVIFHCVPWLLYPVNVLGHFG